MSTILVNWMWKKERGVIEQSGTSAKELLVARRGNWALASRPGFTLEHFGRARRLS